MSTLEVLLSPTEFGALSQRDLRDTTCVVFDVLRATTTMMTALANGAAGIVPVVELSEALAIRSTNADVVLGGERGGLRIRATQTGGIDFDLGNSPREFTPEKVAGKTIVMTTTNGTRALRSCSHAHSVIVGTFLNLRAAADWIQAEEPNHLLLICSGTLDQAAYEDVLGAGALCDLIWPLFGHGIVADSAQIARQIYRIQEQDLLEAMQFSRNGRRLLANPDLKADVPFCLQRDTLNFVAMLRDGTVQRTGLLA
jgi:2-phosphosulfolactate phosphatase